MPPTTRACYTLRRRPEATPVRWTNRGATYANCLAVQANRRRARRVARTASRGHGDFAGCVVVISHDRWFLNRIATHLLAFEGESKVTFFDGNFSEYEESRRQTLGDAATRPHRITYRKLTR